MLIVAGLVVFEGLGHGFMAMQRRKKAFTSNAFRAAVQGCRSGLPRYVIGGERPLTTLHRHEAEDEALEGEAHHTKTTPTGGTMNIFYKISASTSPTASSVVELLPAHYGLVILWRRSWSGLPPPSSKTRSTATITTRPYSAGGSSTTGEAAGLADDEALLTIIILSPVGVVFVWLGRGCFIRRAITSKQGVMRAKARD